MARINRWTVPIVVGLLVAAGALWAVIFFVRIPEAKQATKTSRVAPAIVISATETANELFALEPLFLPTSHNASVLSLPPQTLHEPGSMGVTFPARYSFTESGGGVKLIDPLAVPSRPVDILNVGEPPNPWPEVGRADVPIMPAAARLAFVEVTETRTGMTVFTQEISAGADMPALASDWAPVEFLVAIDPAGLVAAPVSTHSNLAEDVENFFRSFLTKKFALGARLPPGFYAVRIGP